MIYLLMLDVLLFCFISVVADGPHPSVHMALK